MRHGRQGRKLTRTYSHRKALMANLASALILHRRITTTDAKAKETRRFVEPLVTMARRGGLHSRRLVVARLKRHDAVDALFKEIAPHYAQRPGGYTRILKLGFREHDRAPLSRLEFVDLAPVPEKPASAEEKKPVKTRRWGRKAKAEKPE